MESEGWNGKGFRSVLLFICIREVKLGQANRFKDSYEVIVAGVGIAGLSAALNLAREGISVLLLEQHNMTGGYAASFVRGRYEFELLPCVI
jgi:heterodisulfide reductase subunit A-like polyferredoxin